MLAAKVTFDALTVEDELFVLMFEYLGEGDDGDYRDNGLDRPRLRFTLYDAKTGRQLHSRLTKMDARADRGWLRTQAKGALAAFRMEHKRTNGDEKAMLRLVRTTAHLTAAKEN